MGARPLRRFDHFEASPTKHHGLRASHPAVIEGRTLFPTTVVDPEDSPRLLVSGINQRKIGDRVTKGRWRGFKIFCLTLEERATCPTSCYHYRSCYGNSMYQARRHRHGPELEHMLAVELAQKQREHPRGFVVRLHILGDFMSRHYALLWCSWMARFPALRVFGYTARDRGGEIGEIIAGLNAAYPDRFAVRFSVEAIDPAADMQATTIFREPEAAVVPEGLVCPAQTGKTNCCGTCGLCWTMKLPVVFMAHGAI